MGLCSVVVRAVGRWEQSVDVVEEGLACIRYLAHDQASRKTLSELGAPSGAISHKSPHQKLFYITQSSS